MLGTSTTTGKSIEGIEHLRQSVCDILTTPIGSRVMRRDYGSRLFSLVDSPSNQSTLLEIYMATTEALMKWESRISVDRVYAESLTPGKVVLSLQGTYIPDGSPVVLDGLIV
ncbi:MAG: GPW/gp25 family protein [Chthoniobacteraceae bacterium]